MERKLGFGGMRLPLADPNDGGAIDIAELSRMVDLFLERGFTCFDTARTYHDGHAETALRRTLVERHPRSAYVLTDKLPTLLVGSEERQERIFGEQLAACGVEYFDRYLIHCATAAYCAEAERLRSFDFVRRKRNEGRIRQIGFSYHDSPELLEELLVRHPEIDFVQLQISYVDWEHTPIRARQCYETARRHGKPVVAMCPLKGGMLAEPPAEVEQLFRTVRPDLTPAAWAIRFAASLEGVTTVLSGMSSLRQLDADTAAAERFGPLTDAEQSAFARAAELVCRSAPVQCTGCGYCLPTCPQGIPIPDDLLLYNAQTCAGREGLDARISVYRAHAEGRGLASACVACRHCERACPQHLHIVDWLGRVADLFERRHKAAPCAP